MEDDKHRTIHIGAQLPEGGEIDMLPRTVTLTEGDRIMFEGEWWELHIVSEFCLMLQRPEPHPGESSSITLLRRLPIN